MVSCSFVHHCCVMTHCFFLFGASSHPYPFEDFPLYLTNSYSNTVFIVHGYVVGWPWTNLFAFIVITLAQSLAQIARRHGHSLRMRCMVSCSFLFLICVSFSFEPSPYPFIINKWDYGFSQPYLYRYFVGWPWTNSNLLKAVAMAEAGCSRHPQRQCIVSWLWHLWTGWWFQWQALAIRLQC